MNAVSQVAALVGALAYLGAAPVEMFFFSRPAAQRFLHVHTVNVVDIRTWAFIVGLRNLLAGVGTIIGLAILHLVRSLTSWVVGADFTSPWRSYA
jgi:putative membrane protein